VHCPIIAEVSHKINTFFKKIPIIFLLFPFPRVCCGENFHRAQDIDVPLGGTAKKIFVKRNFFAPKTGHGQNVDEPIVTNCHLLQIALMLTAILKKVQNPILWKNLWRMWKTRGFQGSFPCFSQIRLWIDLQNAVTFGGNFPDCVELCCDGKSGWFPTNSCKMFPFSVHLPQKSRPPPKRGENFLLKFHKALFV
jgi:hypothetical protein